MKNRLNIITFASALHEQSELFGEKREILNFLRSEYELSITDGNSGKLPEPPCAIFIGTGGTERLLLNRIKELPSPLIVLSDSYHNSLAASLEISSWLHNNGVMHKHINFPVDASELFIENFKRDIDQLTHIQKTFNALAQTRIGLIGSESDWLISSAVDRDAVEKKYGVKFTDISIEQAIEAFKTADNNCENNEYCGKLGEDRKQEELPKALKMYNALDSLCKKDGLSALTIKCFDLLAPCDTTACLALSMLNDQGIIAGCEGDIPSLWSMILAKHLCGSASFMSNPSAIDRNNTSIDFAHCTTPISLATTYTLPSHYESRMGIAVAAQMKLGKYTLFKCGGANLDKFYVFEGEMTQNTSIVERCRTQIKFKFRTEEEIDRFLQSYLGNHVILIPGHHRKIIEKFFA